MEEWVKEYWVKALFGGIISAFGVSVAWAKKKFKRQVALELGIQALLRNEIRQAYKECVNKGYCSLDDMENIQDMYDSYHDLGGNGSVTRLMEKLKEMDTEESKKEKEC